MVFGKSFGGVFDSSSFLVVLLLVVCRLSFHFSVFMLQVWFTFFIV